MDLPLMQSVYSIFYQSLVDGKSFLNNNTLTISASTIASYMNAASRNNEHQVFCLNLFQFDSIYVLADERYLYKFLSVSFYDAESKTLQFDVSLLKWILDKVHQDNTITVKKPFKKEFIQTLPTHSFLIHSNISRKNKNAYYLVTQIEALLVQAGNKAEEVHITFENLIDKIPTLQRALEKQKTADKNKTLKRAFIKTYELLRKSTDIYLYYKDLQVVEIIPTTTTLDKSLIITHKGINKDYKQR